MTKTRLIPPAAVNADAAAADALTRRIGVDPARTESFRTGYVRLMRLSYVLTFAIFVLIVLLVYAMVSYKPEDTFYAQTSEGAVSQLAGLERPYVTQQMIFDWAAESASQIMTFGFNDYDQKLSDARHRFTDEGWVSFAQQLNKSAHFQTVVSAQQLVTAVPSGTPLLLFEGLEGAKYHWIVEVPLMLTVRSGSLSRSLTQTVRLVIVPVETQLNPMGIAIDRWISF